MRDYRTDEMDVLPGEEILTVSVLARDDLDSGFRDMWRGLDDDLAVPNPFFSEWFLGPALDYLDAEDAIRLCCVTRANGDLVALFPFEIGARYARLPLCHIKIWQHSHACNGMPLLRKGWGFAAFSAILDWLDERPFGARFLRLAQLPYDAPVERIVNDACALAHRAPREQSRVGRAVLTATKGYGALVAGAMSGKKYRDLRRQERRFGELGAARFIDLPTSEMAIAQATEDFLELEDAGWKATAPHGVSLTRREAERMFFREAMRRGAYEGAVSCLVLALDLEMTAMLFTLRSGRNLSAFRTSYDKRHAAYSPGIRLLMEATRRTLDEPGTALFDSCARPGHPVVDRLWPGRLPIVQLNIPTRHAGDAALLDLAVIVERTRQRVIARQA